MRRLLVILPLIMFAIGVSAEETFYLKKSFECKVLSYEEGSLRPVDSEQFINIVLKIRELPKNPGLVAFKQNGIIYVTKNTCIISSGSERVRDEFIGGEFRKRSDNMSEQDRFNSYKYFIEIESGVVNIGDKSAVVEDYNKIFLSSTSKLTTWSKAEKSKYKTGPFLSVGFGIKANKNRFLAFKFRMLYGHKTDSLTLTDDSTSISQPGGWMYEDSFKNFYGGYKFIFMDHSAWKPVIAGYFGVSHMMTTMTDGEDIFKLSSIGPAAIFEIGIDYNINSDFGITGMLGFEYMGNRKQNFSNESMGRKFLSNMNYNNQYISIGAKYYFK